MHVTLHYLNVCGILSFRILKNQHIKYVLYLMTVVGSDTFTITVFCYFV